MKTIRAIYEYGVFRPLETVELRERTEVEFEPKVVGVELSNRDALDRFTKSCRYGSTPASGILWLVTMSISHEPGQFRRNCGSRFFCDHEAVVHW